MFKNKRPFAFFLRVLKLYFAAADQSPAFVQKSYDRISSGYDQTWTDHMRDLTAAMIDKLLLRKGQKVLDLACGTGFAAGLLAQRTACPVIGVDSSGGMLNAARQNFPHCDFIQSDIIEYLKSQPADTFDAVTCCWGMGYSKPLSVLRQVNRVLKPGGRVGIIDNTLFSLREVMACSMLTFMEQPDKLANLMKFRFLMGQNHLWLWFKLAGLEPLSAWQGDKTYFVQSGVEAIERLCATGAAAGFEYAAKEEDAQQVFARFAEILEERHLRDGRIPIIHRFAGGIAVK